MAVATNCLNSQQLQAVINGSVSDEQLEQLSEHIGTCTCCQSALQMAATGEVEIESLIAHGATSLPPKESAYWPIVGALQNLSSQRGSDSDTLSVPTSTPALSFLQPSDDPAYIGKLDHFQIARIIGRGGMGIVLEAFDTHLQRPVAIKVLNPEFAKNDTARQRFCREGRAAAAIAHEHVVSMYQVAKESEGQVAYLVMQLIDGVTLETLLAEGKSLPTQEVARIGMQMAAGLAAAHSRGMVHRDIKPANVLIENETSRVKLTDFGLARASDDVKLTKTGMVTGTPLYMSPEQAMGSAADERSDLFSFGAVLYELATGVAAFQAPSIVGVMKRVMDENPDPPHKINPLVPRKLSDLIMALLEKKPENRPDSAASVASILAGILSEFGPISPLQVPAVAVSDVRRLSGRYRAMSERLSMAALIVGVLGLLSLAISVALISRNNNTSSLISSLEGDTQFPSTVLPGNPGTVWSVDFMPTQDRLLAAVEDGSVRLWDIPAQKLIKSFNAHRGIIWVIEHHPSEPMVATAGDDGMIKLWDAEQFNLIREWRASNAVRGLAFSPDGLAVVAGDREGQIHVFEVSSGKEIRAKSQPGSILGVAYSSDGKSIATVGSDKTVRVWDAETLEERLSMNGHKGPVYNVAFAPGRPLLATVGWGKDIHLWNVDSGQEERVLKGSASDVWGVSFCEAGTHLVTSGQDGTTRIWEVETGKQVAELHGHESAVHNVSLDSRRHRIATSGRDGNIRVWDVSSLKEE